ncbi:hypothetical protein [Microcoleus sp. D3_18a_C4]|uniref:hypothetical protein n=1 Tax=unclassified Microcoleus TaxID=2642155 RepID=UPI002FCEB057
MWSLFKTNDRPSHPERRSPLPKKAIALFLPQINVEGRRAIALTCSMGRSRICPT